MRGSLSIRPYRIRPLAVLYGHRNGFQRGDDLHQVVCEPLETLLALGGRGTERIADHATNIAEEVVYLYEATDIRHADKV